MYTDEVDLTKQSDSNILGLLVASDELSLERLSNHAQEHLNENQTWIQQNFVDVLHTAFKLSRCKKLQEHCLDTIFTYPQSFITTKEFLSLNIDILHCLLKRDD